MSPKINVEQFYQEKIKQYQEEQLLKQTQKQWNTYLYHQREAMRVKL